MRERRAGQWAGRAHRVQASRGRMCCAQLRGCSAASAHAALTASHPPSLQLRSSVILPCLASNLSSPTRVATRSMPIPTQSSPSLSHQFLQPITRGSPNSSADVTSARRLEKPVVPQCARPLASRVLVRDHILLEMHLTVYRLIRPSFVRSFIVLSS